MAHPLCVPALPEQRAFEIAARGVHNVHSVVAATDCSLPQGPVHAGAQQGPLRQLARGTCSWSCLGSAAQRTGCAHIIVVVGCHVRCGAPSEQLRAAGSSHLTR